jgi:hypothetical protein
MLLHKAKVLETLDITQTSGGAHWPTRGHTGFCCTPLRFLLLRVLGISRVKISQL